MQRRADERLARFTASPITVNSMRSAAPMKPWSTSPQWTPIPISHVGCPRPARAAFSSRAAVCMASAARTAFSCWRASGSGLPKTARIPSPTNLSIVPS
jgi:hypothetical protein